jgi:trimethylamine-N-oxide reductase (cytochrome c)
MLMLLDELGGCTQQIRNPDSWEGWYWGAMHVWGTGYVGAMAPADNVQYRYFQAYEPASLLGR